MNKLKVIVAAALLTTASYAHALENEATLAAQFTWIIPDSISSQYPDDNLTLANKHFVSRIEVRKPNGRFELTVTMPKTLVADQTVTTKYVHVSTTDNEMLFRNPDDASDYLKCYERPTWKQVRCSDVTLKGVTVVPQDIRQAFARGLYQGTAAETGMIVVAGAEPGGEIQFLDPEYKDPTSAIGTWRYTYVTVDGAAVSGTMRIDGFSGVFENDDGTVGLINSAYYDAGEVGFYWYAGGIEGTADFQVSQNALTGEWMDQDGNMGDWNATRAN